MTVVNLKCSQTISYDISIDRKVYTDELLDEYANNWMLPSNMSYEDILEDLALHIMNGLMSDLNLSEIEGLPTMDGIQYHDYGSPATIEEWGGLGE